MKPRSGTTFRRLVYAGLAIFTTGLGLASRSYAQQLPSVISLYAGDILWAMTAFIGISLLFPKMRSVVRAALAVSFAFAVELTQLYHATWIQEIRGTWLGGLLLGYGFLWTDLVCYVVGVSGGLLVDLAIFATGPNNDESVTVTGPS